MVPWLSLGGILTPGHVFATATIVPCGGPSEPHAAVNAPNRSNNNEAVAKTGNRLHQ